MNNFFLLVSRYLSVHKKRTRLAIISVAISVALITGVFSMLDVFLRFEKIQVIHEYGNYHLAIHNASKQEIALIKSRIDVQNSGQLKFFHNGTVKGITCRLGALDQTFAENMNVKMLQGRYPDAKNEIMLEKWATESLYLNAKVGDGIRLSGSDKVEREYVVSGFYNDLGTMKAAGVPVILLSTAGTEELMPEIAALYLVKFKEKVNIQQAVKEIKSALNLPNSRVELNNHLLAVIGQSKHNAATGLYIIGAILFCLVLLAGVVMIFNTMNISVMERVRQIGLLRCIGASPSQIKKLVNREGLTITIRALPLGILLGMLFTLICCMILKFYNRTLFGEIPLFSLSYSGIAAGVGVGFLTVLTASFFPARKAAKVSPVNAVTGSNQIKTAKRMKRGWLTKFVRVEYALGINNAVLKKKTLFLMSCSIAISIILFLGFNILVDFLHTSLKTTKPYTPDISITSEQGLEDEMPAGLSQIDGVKKVYGRMFSYVDASFDASRLTESYQKIVKGIAVKDNGLIAPLEKSWLISYDKNQFNWAKVDLIEGELSEDKLDAQNGVVAVAAHLRKGIMVKTTNLHMGDKVYIETPGGTKELNVMGILRSVSFVSAEPTMTTFVTTEALFTKLTGVSRYRAIDIQLKRRNQEQVVNRIKGMVDPTMTFLDLRQKNDEMNQFFLTTAVFIYGFILVIALISILNIINTMNTSVASKTRYLGVLRAVGISNAQLDKMVLTEAATYSVLGCLVGCILGTILQKELITHLLTSIHVIWRFPLNQLILIVFVTMMITVLSVINPIKRIKTKPISEVVNSL